MRVKHSTLITCRCPVDTSITDIYELTVIVNKTVPVENILSAIKRITKAPAFQETITETLARELKAEVCTIGTHSGVKTECSCDYSLAQLEIKS